MDVKEKLEDTKEVIRCRKWTKDKTTKKIQKDKRSSNTTQMYV